MSTITAHAIVYEKFGNPVDVIKSHSYTIDLTSLKPDEVILQALASPINPSDLVQIKGIYPSRPPLSVDSLPESQTPIAVTGNEGLFKIIVKGSAVTDYEIGDWCVPLRVSSGTWCTHRVLTQKEIFKMSNEISKTQAATISVNPPTAYLMLTDFVKLQPGDWFVQNGANSQVGKLAIQIAKKLGINSLNIVRRRDNFDELVKDLTSFGATKIITEEDVDTEELKEFLKDKKVKLGLDCVGGSSSLAVAKLLCEYGTMVVYGSMTRLPIPLTVDLFIYKTISVTGFWLSKRLKHDPSLKASATAAVVELINDDTISEPEVHETFVKISELTNETYLKTFLTVIANTKNGKQLIKYE